MKAINFIHYQIRISKRLKIPSKIDPDKNKTKISF